MSQIADWRQRDAIWQLTFSALERLFCRICVDKGLPCYPRPDRGHLAGAFPSFNGLVRRTVKVRKVMAEGDFQLYFAPLSVTRQALNLVTSSMGTPAILAYSPPAQSKDRPIIAAPGQAGLLSADDATIDLA